MAERDIRDEPVDRLKDALEFLRDESIRLHQSAVTHAIVRALSIIRAQSQCTVASNRLH